MEKEVKSKATCPKCEGQAEFKWMINNPFGKNLIYPEFVAVGYDNYKNGLQEPELENVEALIHGCENRGIKVYRKTLREQNSVPNLSLGSQKQ